MAEDGGWAQPNGFLPNGLLPREAVDVTRAVDAERWAVAEEHTAELIARIQPNQPSEERRNAVANYVQRLIMKCFSCQVCTFGSVPLKTYLPDGDIDLTAFSKNENLKDTWASTVRDMLENEEKSVTAEFHVKEVQYIQAEVKIIKCLVENIVVDISFNQVGGLCTLCFLDEIDHLINQNHLFKRSIILIKAWCYYESRILGAHHGLISTYALETLVLYIFHVFNNSFAGPLEVLYRFLQFFGNFDWENFCVSLWGPVPISSLPEMTAEPPRKDGGELLLSKLFLNLCSTIYAVFPSGQESQSQPFVSKHFNVIDPLRTNNNLGRSVSKGNFYRIRSAFAFGAKRLARLLECPKENLIAEVNKFFTNTWERHGSGYRPDAPGPNLGHLSPLKSVPVEESNKSRSSANIKKKSHTVGLMVGHEHHAEGTFAFQGSTSQVFNAISHHSETTGRASNFPAVPYSQKNYGVQSHSGISDRFERGSSSGSSTPVDKSQKSLRPDNSVNDREGQTRFQFARTQSSPELTDTSAEVKFKARRNRVVNTGKERTSPARSDYVSRRKNIGSEISIDPNAISSLGDPSLRQISSLQSLEVASYSHTVSKSHCDNDSFASIGEVHNSASESFEMQKEMNQEEQDLVNMMACSRIHNFNGQVQFPMHLASSHLPLSSSPILASIGYAQRNMAGLIPTNFPLVDPSWGLNVHFPPVPLSSPLPHYFPSSIQDASPDDLIESGNENSGMTDLNLEDPKHSFWQENDGGTGRGFDLDNGGLQTHHFDDKQLSTSGSNNLVSSSRANSSTTSSMDGHRFGSENREAEREDTGTSQYQSRRVNDFHSVDRNGNMGSFHVSQASSVRNKWGFASPRDSSPSRISKSTRDKWGRKPVSSVVRSFLDVGARSGRQGEGSSDDVSAQEGNDSREWVALSTGDSNLVNRATGSTSSAVSHPRSHQLSGYEQPQISGSDSVIPSAPMLVGSSQQRAVDNPEVVPLTFYPTGPPVPFITMLPVYNFPSDAGNSSASSSQFARDDVDHSHVNQSAQNFDSKESINQPEGRMSLTASTPEGLKSDILKSDFASNWQNLQYGRLCQNVRVHGPLIYPSVMVPPVYFHGHYPLEGPGRPLSTNVNVFSQMMGHGPRLVPVAPHQPGSLRPSGVFHRYGDDAAPRFLGGTGTYLPNPKVSYRDRHYSNSRSHRGSYNYERNDHIDGEGSWVNSKSRAAVSNHGRNPVEKPSPRLDSVSTAETRSDRHWDGFRNGPVSSNQFQNSSFRSTSSATSSADMQYSIYPLPAMSSNGVGPNGPAVPSVVMLYSYDQGISYSMPTESLEFGSLGPVHLSGVNEVPQQTEGSQVRGVVEQRHGSIHGDSRRSSPDQPSSPQVQRSVIRRNYQLKDEDFPPLPFPNEGRGAGGD